MTKRFRVEDQSWKMTKRFRVGGEEVEMESINMANMLMFLSRSGSGDHHHQHIELDVDREQIMSSGRVFECKTCNRRFGSFQALGGHRASHKKPKSAAGGSEGAGGPVKAKVHECSICGLEFAIGQALGGHMRRHRAMTEGFGHHQLMVEKKSHGRRVLCLDLNMPPPPPAVDHGSDDNDHDWLKIGTSGIVDCLI